jgi:WhiB family redox-sensing transcriptional regulator
LPVGLRPPTNRTRVNPRVALERAKRRWRAPSWAEQASCAGQTDLFFGSPTETDRERTDRERQALAVCAVCPVVAPCRDHARRFREAGIWGGENEAQRRAALKLEKREDQETMRRAMGTGLGGDTGVAG